MAPRAVATRSHQLAWAVALFAASAAAFLPALVSGFVADDFFILARLKAQGGLAGTFAYFRAGFFDYYRPAAFVSQAIDWHLWGANAFGFHLTNLVVHGVSTVLLWRMARRLVSKTSATIAALFFAWHPAAHEPVYWIAARFDLLATMFGLAALAGLAEDARRWRVAGVIAFAIALLSKESAIAILVIAPAWDVFITARGWRETTRRLLPLLGVAAIYATVRSAGADLSATGGVERLPKLLMTAASVALVVAAAWRLRRGAVTGSRPRALAGWLTVAALLGVASAALFIPVTTDWTAAKLGWVAYAVFYLLSPVIFPTPPPGVFTPNGAADALAGLLALAAFLLALGLGSGWLRRRPAAVFAVIFIGAGLLPVSSMTGGLRYLYFAGAGVSLLVGVILDSLADASRRRALAVLGVVLVLSLTQLMQAARAWRWAGTMTRDGVTLMSRSLDPCGTKDVLMLTAPVGIGGVYSNLYWEAFDVTTGCAPASFSAVLRVVRTDSHVDVSTPGEDVVEIRIPAYTGNVVASKDLRNFGEPVERGRVASLDTAAGRLDISHDGNDQVFRLTMTERARGAEIYYFSDGQVRALPPRHP